MFKTSVGRGYRDFCALGAEDRVGSQHAFPRFWRLFPAGEKLRISNIIAKLAPTNLCLGGFAFIAIEFGNLAGGA